MIDTSSNKSHSHDLQDNALSVIKAEIQGLEALKASLSGKMATDFAKAIETIHNTAHHLIVVGIGKSGHIGRKLAASFASTGTPAFFMHPSEALHGDLGMISQGCTLLLLSNSGESQDLRAVIRYAKALKVPIIGMTSKPSSTLAKTATIALLLPQGDEACPNGLAPTTSTTNMLALGDALFVAVMQLRGFTREDFGRRHPGGKLGLQLQTIADWMAVQNNKHGDNIADDSHEIADDGHETVSNLQNKDLPVISQSAKMDAVIMAITSGAKGCVAVIEDDSNKMIGMITDGDLRRAMGDGFMARRAADIMSPSPLTLSPDMLMSDVIALFAKHRISNAFVIEADQIVALIDMKSLMQDGYV